MTKIEAVTRLGTFHYLEHKWDSYGAVPIDPVAIKAAGRLLEQLGDGWQPVPCSDGSVQLEGRVEGREVEIRVFGWDA